ncbi:hypothetical protein HHL16_04755 [Pseudoflavitalea sp. G-6-1-2]|uniref:hypothetical protein n=1 Tax=Pseudoflavitalea sp. G-6-1-2 TaxID=2728841 RepID=UPI00146E774D|nr:hypothetical protein [Pseudoflavitalea sp. G-6-1-2]NML20168.1 hypothetical protein [Pseudoflavitalea sp. G-6-1-2]
MGDDLRTVVRKLLGRPLRDSDGIPVQEIEKTEYILNASMPDALKEWFGSIGNVSLFMSGFQRMYTPATLILQDGKLIFMEENQGVCYWAVDMQQRTRVYQSVSLIDPEWYDEGISLSDFLVLMLYYQYVQGNPIQNVIAADDEEEREELINNLERNFEKVADHNGLAIYSDTKKLCWFFYEESITDFTEINETAIIPFL